MNSLNPAARQAGFPGRSMTGAGAAGQQTANHDLAGYHPAGQGKPGQGAPRRAGRLAVIDGLRISAALMVAIYHYTSHETRSIAVWGDTRETVFPGVSDIFKYGFLGVELFFMISGFVICMSSWGRTPGQFANSRIVRLFPAFWPAVLLTAAVGHLWPVFGKGPNLDQILLNLTMLNAPAGVPHIDPVYWTLWAEARFYLLFAVALLWRGLTLRRTMIFGYAWLIAAVAGSRTDLPILNLIFQPEYAPYFVAGIALFLIHRFGPDLRLWGLVGLSYAMSVHNVSLRATARDLNTYTATIMVTGFFLVLIVIALGYTARIQWGWLTTAGALTYPFYLLHENIGWTLIRATRDAAPRYVVVLTVLAAMLAFAWLLHRYVEKPVATWLKAQLSPPPSVEPAVPAPPAHARPVPGDATMEMPVYRA